jgi:hypothetical protein
VYVDVNNDCVKASFNFGPVQSTRKYDIKVTQFDCQTELGGPPGCLQYHTATSGTIASFNYPIGTTVVSSTATNSGKNKTENPFSPYPRALY